MPEPVRTVGGLRADSALWLFVAAILFVASAFLTRVVTHVERHPPQDGLVLAFSGPPQSGQPIATFAGENDDLALTISNIDVRLETLSFGPLRVERPEEVSCSETDDATVEARESPLVQGRLEPWQPGAVRTNYADPQTYAIDVAQLKRDHPYKPPGYTYGTLDPPREVTCRFASVVVHDTYTSRSLRVVMLRGGSYDANGNPSNVTPDNVSFSDEDARDIRILRTLKADTTHFYGGLPAPYSVEFTWESITAGQHRDIVIVVIGTLIALGAAAVIEAARPYIDGLVRRPGESESS